MSSDDLAVRRALITGASSGIGAVFAERLARQGATLTLVARDRERLQSVKSSLESAYGASVELIPADLSRHEQLGDIEGRIRRMEDLDLLVNNAGFLIQGRFHQAGIERQEEMIRLHATALMRLTHAALPGMLDRRRGAIIQLSSILAYRAAGQFATLCATKAFVSSFTRALQDELRGSGVHALLLSPGPTRTAVFAHAGVKPPAVPGFVWTTPDKVVDEALAALRRGSAECIPGVFNQVTAWLFRHAPRRLVRRLPPRPE
jgi:uncharacterized protein